MRITAMVIFILIGSTVFSLVFQGVDGGRWIEHLLTDLPGGQIGFLIFVNIFIFFLAFFLDFFEIAFIVIPLLAPVAAEARHRPDLVRRADRASTCRPPSCTRRSASRCSTCAASRRRRSRAPTSIWGAIPWVVLQLILVAIVIFWPGLGDRHSLDKPSGVDPTKLQIEVPAEEGEPTRYFEELERRQAR